MTSKERAALKAKANKIDALFQVGKGGVSDALIAQVNGAFDTRELIKLKVLLETAPDTPKNIALQIAEASGCEIVQVIGGAMIFYKHNPKLHENKTAAYEKPVTERVKIKKKPALKKSGTSNKPNSKKRKMNFTIKESKSLKKDKRN